MIELGFAEQNSKESPRFAPSPLPGSSPQDDVLLTGERDKNAPFSMHLSGKGGRDMPVERLSLERTKIRKSG